MLQTTVDTDPTHWRTRLMNRETVTTPYINLVRLTTAAAFSEEYRQLCALYPSGKAVQFVKEKLGKQDYCFTGEFRYWVWEREAPDLLGDRVGWRIYVSNKKGIGFEVDAKASPFEALQAWLHFQELMGIPRGLPYLDVFQAAVSAQVESIAEGTAYLQDTVRALGVYDDGDPEGGVLVNVTFGVNATRRSEVGAEKIREWIEQHLKARVPMWSQMGPRTFKIEFEGVNFEGLDQVHLAYYYPGVRMRPDNYMALAHRIWKAKGGELGWAKRKDFEDDVLRICVRGDYLETVRLANNNPTTMVSVSADGIGYPIRHHGEHFYLTKRLLQLAEGA